MEAWQNGSEDHYSADGFESEPRGSSMSPTERRKDASRGLQVSSSFSRSIMDVAAPEQVSEGLEGLAAAAFTYKGSSSSSGSRSRSSGDGDRQRRNSDDDKEDSEGSVYSDAFLRASDDGLATGFSGRPQEAAGPWQIAGNRGWAGLSLMCRVIPVDTLPCLYRNGCFSNWVRFLVAPSRRLPELSP